MPLMALEPPSTLPAGKGMRRPPRPGTGSETRRQLRVRWVSRRVKPAGMWISGFESFGPASSSSTRLRASSASLPATAAPPEPAPMTM